MNRIGESQPMGWLFLVYTVARGESRAHRLRRWHRWACAKA